MKLCEYQRSRSFIDRCPSHADSIFSNFFSSITARPIETKFHDSLQWDGGMEGSSNGFDHMTKTAAMPIYGENLKKNLHLRNQKADDPDTWYAAFGIQVLPNSLKWWPWVDLDLFYSKVKFGVYVWENAWPVDFLMNYLRLRSVHIVT